MAKALFFSLPAYGHTNPTLPLIRELADRGEDIVYYSTGTFSTSIERAGARYRPYRSPFLMDMRSLPERLDELSWLLMRTTEEVLADELEAVRAERPDYLITDSVAPWGQWIGQILKIPVVTSVSTFAFNRHVMAYGLSHGVRPKSLRLFLSKLRYIGKSVLLSRRLSRLYNVPRPPLMETLSGRSGLTIVYTSRHFQPCAETFDGRYLFVGPSMAPRADDSDFPWQEIRHPVLVYISLGTLFNKDPQFYRSCFEAFGDRDCQVVLSVGGSVSPGSLGLRPANFIVRPRVPQLEVLQRASVFITHGGMNSVSESLFLGVPLLAVPQMGEQEIVARRVEELGAGLHIARTGASAEVLRESVAKLLAQNHFRERAAKVRDSFLAAGGVARAAGAVIAHTR